MKTQQTTTQQTELELNVLSKRDMVLVKTTLVIFGIVLNICCYQLFF